MNVLSYVIKSICPITGVDTSLAVTRVRSPWFTVIICMWQGMAVPRFNTWVLSGYSGFLPHQWPPGIDWFELAYAYNNITTFSKSTCYTFFFLRILMSFFLQSGSVLRIFVKVYLKTKQFQLTNILSDNPLHIGNTSTCILPIELFFVRICFQSFCVIYTIKCVQIKSYSSNSLLLVHLFSWQWLYFKQSLSIPIVLMYFFFYLYDLLYS